MVGMLNVVLGRQLSSDALECSLTPNDPGELVLTSSDKQTNKRHGHTFVSNFFENHCYKW